MDQVLYDLMDWAGIEEIVYSEAANPERLLGAHEVEEGLLIQVFMPHAVAVAAKVGNESYPMELQDEAGYYAVLLHGKKMSKYLLEITYDNGTTEELQDPYAFPSQFTDAELKKFDAGIYYDVYRKMGAHPMTIDGVKGVYFAVWAPCAMRVSVVGDFNMWDGRRHQMKRLGDSGVFELFMPGLEVGALYKYEIKNHHGEPMLKSDPYGNYSELRPDNASIVWDLEQFSWNDEIWMKNRELEASKDKPLSIYELHLGSWMRHELKMDEDGEPVIGSEFYNYREIAPKLAEYVKKLGYTHVELMPVMEHPLDESWGYQVTGYYAPTSRYGTPDDFMYFMNYMHEQGIGVILDWVPAHFPRDAHGLANFDGEALYEHPDSRRGEHPDWGTKIFNYEKSEVRNFLIANALFWLGEYHIDGLRVDAVASMLYLDYGKQDGQWLPNKYGGNENLDAVWFFKHLNSVVHGRGDGSMIIAEESTAWPQITGSVKENGLGFDYKWNMGWMNDFTGYMQCDPYFRNQHYGELTFSMFYAYSEDFVLVFSHDEVVHGKSSMLCKMPGETYEEKAANLRTAYGFMYGHPGKKLLFMGQEFAQISEWNENEELPWNILEYPLHKNMQDYVTALNELYRTHPAMYQKDFEQEGFEWINCTSAADNIVVFTRKTDKPEETLLFVCNFAPVLHEKYQIGLPFAGRYKEIFNSDAKQFGGSGKGNSRVRAAKKEEYDGRDYSMQITVPPMSMIVFSCEPAVPKKTAAKKSAAKKPAAEKTAAAKKTGTEKSTAAKKISMGKSAAEKKTAAEKSSAKTETVKKAVAEAKKAAAKTAENGRKTAEEAVKAAKETAAAAVQDVVKKAKNTAKKTAAEVKKAADKATEKATDKSTEKITEKKA